MFFKVIFEPNATSGKQSEYTWALQDNDKQTKRIIPEIIPDKMSLEESAYLCVTRTGMVENHKMELK